MWETSSVSSVAWSPDGLKLAFRTLDTFRATVAAAACGLARRALDESLSRARSRRQFGKPLAEFQGTQFRLAAMATRLEAARGLVFRAAWLRDRGERPTLAASMAKLAATNVVRQREDTWTPAADQQAYPGQQGY